ncbi:hypothetical protein RJ640_029877 [Escallonia rubra]|uniref:Retroviral polymerase SH3-like domain-containing protein n=1 Tax=Escallonia rubra TaxID=112253 RepID=A0AA88RYW1_9ASTE|nr:hypothetical protein RJ640_029877 [Escallonia rubra]
MELERRKLKDLKAKNYLFQAIDCPILETILSKETSKDIWDSMKKKYQGSSRVKRAQLQALRSDFETFILQSPTFAVQNMTPEKAWNGRRPAVDHFRIFGYIAYAHVPDEKMKKLDDKSEKCVFLGVSEVSKAYKLFNPLTKKIVTSRDIVFEEENTWDWNRQQLTPVIFDSDAKEKMKPTPMISMLENASNATPTVAETLPATAEATDVAIHSARRAGKRPAWMKDYKYVILVLFTIFLGIQVKKISDGILLTQEKYIEDLLKETNMATFKPCSTPLVVSPSLSKTMGDLLPNSEQYRQVIGAPQ